MKICGGFGMAQDEGKTLSPEAFEAISQRFRVLSDPMRLKILYNLKSEELTVTDIVERTGGSQSNVSKHLSLMLANGIVQRRREGTSAYYSIVDSSIFDLCDSVCGGIENDLENRRRAFQ
jgi:DNA-binding transcriptional ArsR family regulator